MAFDLHKFSRALARFDAETFQRRVNCYIVPFFFSYYLSVNYLNKLDIIVFQSWASEMLPSNPSWGGKAMLSLRV